MAGVFGALFGSFLNVCIVRMPEDRSVAWPGSACPHCGKPVRPYDNVPVLAWFWLGGRCRDCKTPFSALYPAIEALFALLMVLLFRRVIPDISDFDAAHVVALVWYGWLVFALVGLTFIDLRHKIIPDAFSMYSVPVGVGGAALLTFLGFSDAPTWQQSVVGAVCGGLGLWLVMKGWSFMRKVEAMGMGDVKLLVLIGSYFATFPALPGIMILASVLGSGVGIGTMLWIRRRELTGIPSARLLAVVGGAALLGGIVGAVVTPGAGIVVTASVLALAVVAWKQSGLLSLPFGPFLAVSAIVWLFFGDGIVVRWASGFAAEYDPDRLRSQRPCGEETKSPSSQWNPTPMVAPTG